LTSKKELIVKYSAWIAHASKGPIERENVDLGLLGAEDVEVEVEHCGLCHSDLSIYNDDWVGVGWFSGSCLHCRQCLSGNQHLCAQGQMTIVGHRGGFATHVRAQWPWVIPLPEGTNSAVAGPLLCAGVTVFAPLAMHAKPTDHVGVVGVGGLGHLAIKFAAACGCEVTAFTSSEDKVEEAKRFGAHHVVSTRDTAKLKGLGGRFDLLLSTINVPLDWSVMLDTLAPNGRLHLVGVVLEPLPVPAPALISRQRSVSGSLTGSPSTMVSMLEFAARHRIEPQTEHFPMSRLRDALARLASGKARYRVVLDADW
jgi:uncharacterized zinc-type alcohol dehydrogenase-like protein